MEGELLVVPQGEGDKGDGLIIDHGTSNLKEAFECQGMDPVEEEKNLEVITVQKTDAIPEDAKTNLEDTKENRTEFYLAEHDMNDDSVEEFVVTDPNAPDSNGIPSSSDPESDADLERILEASATKALEEELAALEKSLRVARKENREQAERMRELEEEGVMALMRAKAENDQTREKAARDVELARKEKEAMVMKYAVSEKEGMTQRREKEAAERRLREVQREREGLVSRLKSLGTDKARLAQALDHRGTEVLALRREVDRLKEEVSSRESKIKWMQTKLGSEQEHGREIREQLELCHRDLLEARKQTADALASLPPAGEGEAEKQKLNQAQEENNALVVRLQSLESQRLEWEGRMARLQAEASAAKESQADLQHRLAEADGLSAQLAQERDRLEISMKEEERLRTAHADLVSDMNACRAKEAELLDFTQNVTAKNVRLQFDCSSLEARLQAAAAQAAEAGAKLEELERRALEQRREAEKEMTELKIQLQRATRKAAQAEEEKRQLDAKLQEVEGDMQVMKRKNAAGLRETTREMQQLRRRLLTLEQGQQSNGVHQTSSDSSPATMVLPTITTTGGQQQIDPQILVQRIVKLQRMLARRAEKVDFLEEHSRHLTEALQKKAQLLQALLLRQEPAGLASHQADFSKNELLRHGGVMASVYGSRVADEGLTLELSLEMNRRLQGLLEDTLLKNMTLKDSLNTLGEEISRLGLENRQLREKVDRDTVQPAGANGKTEQSKEVG